MIFNDGSTAMDLYQTLYEAAKNAGETGLSKTAAKLYEAIFELSVEETTYTEVVSKGVVYRTPKSDALEALEAIHDARCTCSEDFRYSKSAISLCEFSIQVNTARYLWVKACEFDGVDPDSSFVVFSEGNPVTAVKVYDNADN